QGIADCKVTHLLKETRIIQQSAAEGHDVTHHRQALRQSEGRVQQVFGLRCRALRGEIKRRGCVDGSVESTRVVRQTAPVPDDAGQKNRAWEKLLWTGK